jgi:predicted permease
MQDRLYRALLRLLPREVRDAYAHEMEVTFRAERRATAQRPAAFARFWLAAVADVVRTAPSYHFDILLRDVRYAVRVLAARPLHLITATGTLALGLGASIAMFAVIDAVLWKPLSYENSEGLVAIRQTSGAENPGTMGYLTFTDLRDSTQTLQYMAAAAQSTATLTGDGQDAERVNVMRVSAAYFPMVGVQAAIGRTFSEAEDKPGPARRVLLLSDRIWRRRFAANPQIINRTVQVGNIPFTVIGVMPADFNDIVAAQRFNNAELWTPLGYDPAASFACRTCRHLSVYARLKPGVGAEAAEQDLSRVITASAAANPTQYNQPGIDVTSLEDLMLGPARTVLLILLAGVGLLLLVACGNVANLLLIRATEREQELAVRTALGVTTGKLVRQLLTEAVILGFAGVALALPLAAGAIRFIVDAAPPGLPRLESAGLDMRAVGVSLALAIGTGLLFGMLPALQARSRRAFNGLRDGTRRTASAGTWRLRAVLVAGNMTMAAVLVVSSGLVAKSLLGLLAVDTGFRSGNMLTARVSLAGPRFTTPDPAANIAQTTQFYDNVLSRVRAIPGVEAAAGVSSLPLGGNIDQYGLHVVGRPLANPQSAPSADRFVVTPGFFETMGIRLERGRVLGEGDRQGAPSSVVVNTTLAREVFPGEDAIGRAIRLGGPDSPDRTIVGIVNDVRHQGLDTPQSYQVYVPQSQWTWAETTLQLVARSSGDAAVLGAPLRGIVREIDAAQPVTDVRLYDDIVRAATGPRRIAAQLLMAFAAVALALAAVGLYGALGVVAGQRRQEIGLRLALGADGGQIGRLLLLQGLRPAVAGLVAGLMIVGLAGGVLGTLLYGIDEFDASTFGLSALVLLIAAAVACAIPARRAARVDPATALRAQ